jgi:hypothetical protein
LEIDYETKLIEARKKIEDNGGFWKIGKGHELYKDYEKYQQQPYRWYKKEDWQNLKLKYTNENVISLVNNLFDCNFTEIVIDYCHLTTDDYISTSPKINTIL